MISPVAASPRPPRLATPAGFWRLRAARFALAWIGALLILFNLPDLFAGGIDVELIHLSRHQSAFSMALGASFLFVAWRPDRAYGMVPIAVVFAVAILGAVVDLVNGASTLERESIHIAEVVGLLIVAALGISAGPGRRRRHTTPPHVTRLDDA
jgi:predicted anti-sigma-YlaC factor YlaD